MLEARVRVALVLGLALGMGVRGEAAESWPVPRGASREPAPYRYEEHRKEPLPRELLEEVGACYLYAGSSYLIEADGTVETITHEVVRLNGRQSLEELGEHTHIRHDPSYEKLTLNEARVHKGDGRIIEVRPRDVHLRDVSTDYQIYDHEKELVITFPGLEVGDVMEVKWTVRGRNPEYLGQFFRRYSFGDVVYPIVLDELRVRTPAGKPFRWASTVKKLTPEQTRQGNALLYRWHMRNTRWLSREENAPPDEELRPAVAFSTFGSWEEVGRWKHQLRVECWRCTEEVRKVVREVTAGAAGDEARARALAEWLKKKIRYVSIGKEHAFRPHHPEEVLLNRYGDCKDTTQLLAVMLREAGLQVELATLGVWGDGQVLDEVPSPWGTHAILLVKVDGKEHWVDTTASLSAWNFLPRDDRRRRCYLVDDRGRVRLTTTPAMTAAENRTEQTTYLTVGTDGTAHCERRVVSHGQAASSARDDFLEVPAGERRRKVTGQLQDSHAGSQLVNLDVDEKTLRSLDQPVRVQMAFDVLDHFPGSPNREGRISDSLVWSKLLSWNLAYDREQPFELYAPFDVSHQFVIRLPACYRLTRLPEGTTVSSPWGRLTRTVRPMGDDGRGLEVRLHTAVEQTRVERADFDKFRTFQDEVGEAYRMWLEMAPVQDLAEAKRLEEVLKKGPQDRGTAAVLARLYRRHDMPGEALRVLRRTLEKVPEDVELLELAALLADRKEEEPIRRKLLELEPGNAWRKIDLADVLFSTRRHEEGHRLLDAVLREGTPDERAGAYYQLARSHYRRDLLEEARGYLVKAEEADADTVNTVRFHVLRGQTLEELGRRREAIKAYEAALGVDAEAEFALEKLVRLLLAETMEEPALRYLRRYTLAVGHDPEGLLQAAQLHMQLGQPAVAYQLASQVKGGGAEGRARQLLGQIHLDRAEYRKSVEHLEQADLDAGGLEALLRGYLRLGRLDQAARRLAGVDTIPGRSLALADTARQVEKLLRRREQLLAQCPAPPKLGNIWGEALAHVVCAEHLYRLKLPGGVSKPLIEEALRLAPKMGAALAWKARLLLEEGKLRQAWPLAEEAVRQAPVLSLALLTRGRIALERGAPDALRDLRHADELSKGEDGEAATALGEALLEAGLLEEAGKVLERAARLEQGSPAVQALLNRLRQETGPTPSK